jgi:Glucodextranase, domain B
MLLLTLFACNEYGLVEKTVEPEPLVLTVLSPSYGEFLGDGPVEVTGTVSPPYAAVTINGVGAAVSEDGSFAASVPFDDRALVVDVQAHVRDEEQRVLVPVFDSVDPKPYDPGAVQALLSPTGLDALEPMVAGLVDSLGIASMLQGIIPTIDTDYLDVVQTGASLDPSTVDLYPADGEVGALITANNLTLSFDVTVLNAYSFPMEASIATITAGVGIQPTLSEDAMLSAAITSISLDISDINIEILGIELPGWVMDYVVEPVLDLITGGVGMLGDLILSTVGAFELGGPFAFDLDLMGSTLSAKLVEVATTPEGVGLGLTVGIDTPAADSMPDGMPTLPAVTPSGANYQLGAAVHEGMFNTLMDGLLADFLNIDMNLEGSYAEIIGGAFRQLPGGDQVPDEINGWCLSAHTGDARVVRMVAGTDGTLARAYLPDLQVKVAVMDGSACDPWLEATVFATVDLKLDGTEVGADINMPKAWVTYYGATDVDKEEVAEKLTDIVGGMVGLLAGGALSFDLGSTEIIPGVSLSPRVVEIAPLDETGLYGIFLDVF